MAETRKYRPSGSLVGDAVRAALGESVRPVTPGGRPDPSEEKTPAVEPESAAPAVTVRTFTFGASRRPDADDSEV